ncbi:MAG: hypothetical protein RL885_06240 [Planctomycetota bacterium]
MSPRLLIWWRSCVSCASQVLIAHARRPGVLILVPATAILAPLVATGVVGADPSGSARWAEGLAFGSIVVLGLLLAGSHAATALAEDLEQGRMALLRTRSAPGSSIVFGRWLGSWAFFLLWLLLTGVLSVVPVNVFVHQGGPWPTTREFVTPVDVDFGELPEPGEPYVLPAGSSGRIRFRAAALRHGAPVPMQVALAVRFSRRSSDSGSFRALEKELPLEVTLQLRDGSTIPLFEGEVPWQPRLRLKVPPELPSIPDSVILRHQDPDAVLLLAAEDVRLFGGRRPAWLDRFQVAVGLSLLAGLLLAGAICASSAVSAPVALLCALGFFVLGQSSGWLEEVFDHLAAGHRLGHVHGEAEPLPTPARIFFGALARCFGACPDFREFELLDQMLSGEAILWTQLAAAAGWMLLYSLPILAAASWIWNRREIR